MHTYMHMHAHTHTYIHTPMHTNIHTYICACMHTHIESILSNIFAEVLTFETLGLQVQTYTCMYPECTCNMV